jgi:hypothetical protein
MSWQRQVICLEMKDGIKWLYREGKVIREDKFLQGSYDLFQNLGLGKENLFIME